MQKRKIKLSRYTKDWKAIALTKKQSVNWTCEQCGRKCLESGVKSKLSVIEKRWELSVHHADYDPANNSPDNLIALCSACHLSKHQRRRGNITPGQMKLPLSY